MTLRSHPLRRNRLSAEKLQPFERELAVTAIRMWMTLENRSKTMPTYSSKIGTDWHAAAVTVHEDTIISTSTRVYYPP